MKHKSTRRRTKPTQSFLPKTRPKPKVKQLNKNKTQPASTVTQPETKKTRLSSPPLKNDTIFDYNSLSKKLNADAKALNIPSGSAKIFIEKTLKAVEKTIDNKKLITKDDLDRAVYKELKKYHPDLAYVYKNYDKII